MYISALVYHYIIMMIVYDNNVVGTGIFNLFIIFFGGLIEKIKCYYREFVYFCTDFTQVYV